jgi:hypothetical protein
MTVLERQMAADAIALHADAERRWADLRSEVKTMRDLKDGTAADQVESGHAEEAERAYGAVDALDWMLREIDRMTGAKAESSDEAEAPPPARHPVLTSKYVFDVLYSAGFTPWGNGEPGFTTGWYCDAITVDHVGADLPVHGPLEGPRAVIADYARTLGEAGFDTHITVNTVYVRKRAAKTATAGEE